MYQKLADILNGNEANFMLPFYWQHGDHYETIPEEVERIYRSGCRALCVESRPHHDFVGPDWWRDMDLILAEAKKRGMKVWILDDDHFPTGHAAGHIEKYHPDKRRWDIAERHVDVLGPVEDALLITREDAQTKLLGIYAYRRTGEGEGCDGDLIIDFSDKKDDRFVQLTLPEGMWRVC
ncbi:MAG: glycosyl transferase family 2, partial [Clostridia bacterium]|nr:glycosyl transferase family 2 [Clostridia bacterium]